MTNNSSFTAEVFKKDLDFFKKNNIQILFVEPDTEKGFNFPYMIYIPNSPKSTLIMDCLNDYETPMPENSTENLSATQEVYSLFEEMRIKSEHLPTVVDKDEENKETTLNRLYDRLGRGLNTLSNLVPNRFEDAPVMVPLIPGYKDNAGMSELGVDIAKDFVPQIVAMIQDAKNLVLERTNIKLNDTIMTYGHSKSSTFANNFTALHPELVQAMMLAGTEEFTLPINEIALQVVEDNEKSENEQFRIINGKATKRITKSELSKIVKEYNSTKKDHQTDITLNANGTYKLPLNFPIGIADIEHYIDLSQFTGGKAQYQKILTSIPRTVIVGEREEATTGHYAYSEGTTLNGKSVNAGDDLAFLDPHRKITEIERASMHNRILEYIAASQALFGKSANERLRNYMQLCDTLNIDAQSKIYEHVGHTNIYTSEELASDCKQYYSALVANQDLTLGNNGRVDRISPVDQLVRRLLVSQNHASYLGKINILKTYGLQYILENDTYELPNSSVLFQKVQTYLASRNFPANTNIDKFFDELPSSEILTIFDIKEKNKIEPISKNTKTVDEH